MILKDQIIRWLVVWKADPQKVDSFLNKINFIAQNNTKEDFFASLLLAISSARTYDISRDELRLAIGQTINLLYPKENTDSDKAG